MVQTGDARSSKNLSSAMATPHPTDYADYLAKRGQNPKQDPQEDNQCQG